MPFGNYFSSVSHDRNDERLRRALLIFFARPGLDRLAHGTRTGARAFLLHDPAGGKPVEALAQLLFLYFGEYVGPKHQG